LVTWRSFFRSGGQLRIESCVAAIDGGALFALVPVRFALALPNSGGEVVVNESRTTMTGNVAASRGGAIATWAPIFVEFGYRLVCTFGFNIYDVAVHVTGTLLHTAMTHSVVM
jgi:predicted outer membrane repeat protein